VAISAVRRDALDYYNIPAKTNNHVFETSDGYTSNVNSCLLSWQAVRETSSNDWKMYGLLAALFRSGISIFSVARTYNPLL